MSDESINLKLINLNKLSILRPVYSQFFYTCFSENITWDNAKSYLGSKYTTKFTWNYEYIANNSQELDSIFSY